jgi:hypothetical protein
MVRVPFIKQIKESTPSGSKPASGEYRQEKKGKPPARVPGAFVVPVITGFTFVCAHTGKGDCGEQSQRSRLRDDLRGLDWRHRGDESGAAGATIVVFK